MAIAKTCGMTLLILLGWQSRAHAQSPRALQLANAVLDAMEFDTRPQRFAADAVMRGTDVDSADAVIRSFNQRYLSPSKLRPPLARAYALVFTEEELGKLAEFYSSPLGKKLERSRPQLAASLDSIVAQAFREHGHELTEGLKTGRP